MPKHRNKNFGAQILICRDITIWMPQHHCLDVTASLFGCHDIKAEKKNKSNSISPYHCSVLGEVRSGVEKIGFW